MSICNDCLQVQKVGVCISSLSLGTITTLGEPVYVYFKNIANGKLQRYETTSDGASGEVKLTGLADEPAFMAWNGYEVTVVKQSAENFEQVETVTVGSSSGTCILVEFESVLTVPDVKLFIV